MNAHQEILRQPVLAHGSLADRLAVAGCGLAVLAGMLAAFSGLGTKWGWWYFMTGFNLLKAAAISGGVAAILSLVGGVMARNEHRGSIFFAAAAGIVAGLLVFGILMSWAYRAVTMPMIHDITTDMVNPPLFKAIMPLRHDAANPSTYGGPDIAAKQAVAYPDIRPLMLPLPAQTAFATALLTAQTMGWQIVDSSSKEGRIEAVATTFWFGFKDDIVVRVTPVPGGSRVDVRSTSRVGLSDIGTNAERIRTYLKRMNEPGAGSSGSDSAGY
jgi:uncharacterized protein (DUF1499 family)